MYGYSLGYNIVSLGSKLNQVPQGVITNKSGTKFLITKSGKYLTIKT